MAGISVPQYEIFKIGTNKLKYYNWDLKITKKEAFKYQELVSLFEAQEFRIMANKILKKNIEEVDFSKIFMQVVIDKKSDFGRATCNKGVTVNGINYLRFVGTTGGLKNNTLLFCNSQYVIDSVHRFIKKKMNDAKIGKLFVQGNYQIASGDPFALMQSICGLKVTGLLKAGECYSKFWIDKAENDVVVFRSPMTSHNNIRKCIINNSDECQRWYQYMDTIMIINAWDSFCMAENGCDWDSDILFSTNNDVLKRRYKELPAIECVQRNTSKIIITERDVKKTNKNGMGNQVGTITNYVTSMMEVQSHFEKTSKEYKELEYRIGCGQLYQQAELDKIKGIVATPMPSRWYKMSRKSFYFGMNLKYLLVLVLVL